jgi:hypothetical protein
MTTEYTYGIHDLPLVIWPSVLTDLSIGDGKTSDSTNFGIFKQNWYMLRTSASEFGGQSEAQVSKGVILK